MGSRLKQVFSPLRLTRSLIPIQPHVFRQYKAELMAVFTSGAGRVLEIGCGRRHYVGYCGAVEYVGVDIDMRPDVFASATHLPFREGSFDGVVMMDVLEHVDDVGSAVGELWRVLNRGGRLLIIAPNTVGFGLYDSFADKTHRHHFSWWGLSKILRKNRFRIEERITLPLHIYLPVKSRLLRIIQQSICVVAVKNDEP
jgi:SAM-dependent methyltransferase